MNAYVDSLLHKESGDPVFLERSREQIEFLLASQHPSGWYEEDWQIGERSFSYEVIGQDGGVTQAMAEQDRIMPKPNESLIWGEAVVGGPRVLDPATGRNIKGPRPDYLGISCLYLHKLIVEAHAIEPETRERWKRSLDRCLAWILSVQRGDGSFPMTVTRDGSVSADSAPCSRLLVALDRIAADRGDEAITAVCRRHEAWVLEHCVANQCWWGSHKDTGLTIDYGGLQTFVQYCMQRFERTRERRYVDLAVECTYYNFFEHCPKQLEWLWHRSTGGSRSSRTTCSRTSTPWTTWSCRAGTGSHRSRVTRSCADSSISRCPRPCTCCATSRRTTGTAPGRSTSSTTPTRSAATIRTR